MPRFALAALLTGLCLAQPAGAATLDDLLSRGYAIAAATRIPGSFTGCVRQHRLVFADGSVFACARTQAQTAYEPRVYILRLGGDPPSVVLAGSAILAGELARLRLHDYAVPLRMNPDPLAQQASQPAGALQPNAAIPSINTLTRQQNAPLSQQQDQLPTKPPVFRSNR